MATISSQLLLQDILTADSISNTRIKVNYDFGLLYKGLIAVIDTLGIDAGPDINVQSVQATDIVANTFSTPLPKVGGGVFNLPYNFHVDQNGFLATRSIFSATHVETTRLWLDQDPTLLAHAAGEVRWSGSDFLGWTGSRWVSFTSANFSVGTFTFEFNTAVVSFPGADPSGGHIAFDTSTYQSGPVGYMYVSTTDINSSSTVAFIEGFNGGTLRLSDSSNPSHFVDVGILGMPINEGAYYAVPVTWSTSSLYTFTNNQSVNLTYAITAITGADNILNAGQTYSPYNSTFGDHLEFNQMIAGTNTTFVTNGNGSTTINVSAISGYSGYSGKSGYSGPMGVSGYSGYSGYSGKSGYSGYSGYSGMIGSSGFSGKSGYSGSGVSGYSGNSGYSGKSGFSGTPGVSGYSGYSGRSGYSGYSGPMGIPGIPGNPGLSGYSGYSGASGFSGSSAGITGSVPYIPYFNTVATVADTAMQWNNLDSVLTVDGTIVIRPDTTSPQLYPPLVLQSGPLTYFSPGIPGSMENDGATLWFTFDNGLRVPIGGSSKEWLGETIQYIIGPSETITVPLGYQYFVYGNLTIQGTLINYGEVVIVNGTMILSGGTFDNFGTLTVQDLALAPVTPSKFAASFTPGTVNVANTITHNLSTTDIMVTLWDVTAGDIITAMVNNRTANTVDITFAMNPAGDVRIVVIG